MKSIAIWLFILTGLFCQKTLAQAFYNPYPLTCTFDSCYNYQAAGRESDSTYTVSNYFYDEQHHLMKLVNYNCASYSCHCLPASWQRMDSIVYSYDSNYTFVSWREQNAAYQNKFNKQGLLAWTKSFISGNPFLATYQYDAAGRPTGINNYLYEGSGSSLTSGNKTLQAYDKNGRLVQRQYMSVDASFAFVNNSLDSTVYDSNGNVISRQNFIWRNNSWRLWNYTTYHYANGHLQSDQTYENDIATNKKTLDGVDTFEYANNRLILLVKLAGAQRAFNQKDTFIYNAAGQLKTLRNFSFKAPGLGSGRDREL